MIMKRLALLCLLLPSTVSAMPENIEARWRTDAMLVRFNGICLIVPVKKIQSVGDDWTPFQIVESQEQNACADVKWVVAPNRAFSTRPTKKLVEGVLVDAKVRIEIGKPCTGEPVKITSAGRWMEVKPGFYALCKPQ